MKQNVEQIEVILAEPRGFCAGVERAIEIVEAAIKKYGAPIYVRHEIVHNKFVVEDLKKKGAIFVNHIDEIPTGAICIFSAHGVSEKVETDAKLRELSYIDATCPLVTKVHNEAKRYDIEGYKILLIGHRGHPEVEGTAGRVKSEVIIIESDKDIENIIINDNDKFAYVTQTTLSVDDTKNIIAKLKEKIPSIKGPDVKDICYATQNRQNAVKILASQVDIIFVIGAENSSNSNRLKDLACDMGIPAFLIADYKAIESSWLINKKKIGITAGASAPEILVEELVQFFKDNFNAKISTLGFIKEDIKFKLPKEVREYSLNDEIN